MVTNMQIKLAITSSQTILQKGMCKQYIHHHLQMYALMFLHHFLTYLFHRRVKNVHLIISHRHEKKVSQTGCQKFLGFKNDCLVGVYSSNNTVY